MITQFQVQKEEVHQSQEALLPSTESFQAEMMFVEKVKEQEE